ncbi:MAG TPA: hypothetical protein VFS21_19855 [Roseiflexaceae bacterium]|nr:hypothetical protein [Roseiflexaceae bacterium]
MASRTSTAAAPPRPLTARERLAQVQQRQLLLALARVLVIPIILLGVLGPRIPSPLFGLDWWAAASPWLPTLIHTPLPDTPLDLEVLTVPPIAVGQWLTWFLVAFLGLTALGLVAHVLTVFIAPALRPLAGERTYVRLLVPSNPPPAKEQSAALLRGLQEMAPSGAQGRARPAPVVLCWTGLPDASIEQAVSLYGPEDTFIRVVQGRLAGVHPGTQAEIAPDMLWAELEPDRVLGVVEVRTLADPTLPIGDGETTTFLRSLLTMLAPQAGIRATGVRIALEAASPARTAQIRLGVQALLEGGKGDLASGEQQILKAKVEQPHTRLRCWIVAIGEQPDAVRAQLLLLSAILAERSMSFGGRPQRLVAGPIHLGPAVPPPRTPLSRRRRWVGRLLGLLLAVLSLVILYRVAGPTLPALAWALPPLLGIVPPLLLAARWWKRQAAMHPAWRDAVLLGVLPARNPGLIPLWSPWFSPREQA